MPKNLFCGFLIFSLLGCIVVAENIHLNTHKFDQNSSKLAGFICDAVDDVLSSEVGMKRVALARYHTTFDDGFMDDIGKCLSSDVSVLMLDLKAYLLHMNLQKPSMIVLLTEKVNQVRLICCKLAQNFMLLIM